MPRFYGTRNVVTRSPDPPLDAILDQLNPIHTATQSFQSNVKLFSCLPRNWSHSFSFSQLNVFAFPTAAFCHTLFLYVHLLGLSGAWGSVVVKALRYWSDGPGIDSRWCHWISQ